MTNSIIILTVLISSICLSSCMQQVMNESSDSETEKQIRVLSEKHADAETQDSLETFLSFYRDCAISMPEYQLTLNGRNEMRAFYNEIFARQQVKAFQRQPSEFIHLGYTTVEIGAFEKEFVNVSTKKSITLSGKYWHIWESQPAGGYKIKAEAYGYFHAVEDPQDFIVPTKQVQPDESDLTERNTPFELRAYNALMEKGVRNRDGLLRSQFFTEDATFYPFADTLVSGEENLRRYMIAHNQGEVNIDSISCYTLDFEDHAEHIIEYAMFKVAWRIPTSSGRISGKTEGKGIRIWKRQTDHSLKLYREIGAHNHL